MSVLYVPFQIVKVAAGVAVKPATPSLDWKKMDDQVEGLRRFQKWDSKPPADPSPPKPKEEPPPDKTPKPAQPKPWQTDPDCQIKRTPGSASGLKTQVCIAENVAQAMTECYNRGFMAAKLAYKSSWGKQNVCQQASADSAWMDKRLKRIILTQEHPQTHRRTITSRKGP